MSYKMVSEYGNAIYIVNTEKEKEHFERLGYKEEKAKAEKNKTSAKRGKSNDKVEN